MSRLDPSAADDTQVLIVPKWLTILAIRAIVSPNHGNDELRPRRAVCFDAEVSAASARSIVEGGGKSDACSYPHGIHRCLKCT
jgi:hypothetical protein